MWFVRVLLPLYIVFYVATELKRVWNMRILLWILLLACVLFSAWSLVHNDSILYHSVPMFALGAYAAYHKEKGVWPTVLILLLCGFLVSAAAMGTSHFATGFIHSFFDYVAVAVMLILLSAGRVKCSLPPVLAAITFDLYLVHFKLLEVGSRYVSLEILLIGILPLTFLTAWIFGKIRNELNKVIRI